LPSELAYQYIAGTPSLGTDLTASGSLPPLRILDSNSGDEAMIAFSPHFTPRSIVRRYSFSSLRR